MKRKIFGILVFFAIIYTGAWFYTAHKLEEYLQNLAYKASDQSLSIEKTKITGFPFHFNAHISKINYIKEVNAPALKSLIDFSSDTFDISTNVLFNYITLTFPNNSSLNVKHQGNDFSFTINSQSHSVVLKTDNLINTHHMIKNAYQQKWDFSDIRINYIKYDSNDLLFRDVLTQQDLVKGNSDTIVTMEYGDAPQYLLRNISIQSKNDNKIFEQSEPHYFTSAFNLDASFVPKDDLLMVKNIGFNNLKFTFDDSLLDLKGSVKDANTSAPDVDLQLKIREWHQFTEKQKTRLSPSVIKLINKILVAASGKEDINEVDLKIYNSQDKEIRIGHISMDEVMMHIQSSIMSGH